MNTRAVPVQITKDCLRMTNKDINELCLKWFNDTIGQRINVSVQLLREKALKYAEELGVGDFTASDCWLDDFLERNDIVLKKEDCGGGELSKDCLTASLCASRTASTSDGVRKKKRIKYSWMKQPSLIKQLKGILSEYPDGGQILKELIQNAEDAGAREVKILFDKRRINDCSNEEARDATAVFTKFFKGPALCVYNDAVFKDDDWEGIQMIYNSVKEKDPLKVGRFGLGFKSVFHITDFPSIVSGDKLLLIDPQQSSGEKVYAMLEVTAIDEYTEEGMDPDAFWRALNNTFDLAKDTLGADGFSGTLFWFPLREKASQLSETLYSETKVNDLFDSFHSEAENVLLFLKNIERISLHIRDAHISCDELISVEVEDEDGKVRKQREDFKKNIENSQNEQEDKDLYALIHMRIRNSSPDMEKRQEWLIVNYFVRESASPDFRSLISDESLGYSPYVGVAAPVNAAPENFEGHVFCFLPLPREGERLTGLPVHINGYFALSQNRHHMKWETDEQEGKKIDDKSILWNKALIKEALPKAYKQLVLEAIQVAEKNSNNETNVSAVYNLLPLCESSSRKTHKRWTLLADKLYEQLEMSNLVYVPHLSEWIPINKACFATLENLSGNKSLMRDSVIRCLQKIGLKYANVPNLLFQTLQIYFPKFPNIEDLTPLKLAAYLRERDTYMAMSHSEKLHVLEYLLSNGKNLKHIQGLQLLPLSSGKFAVFQRSGSEVFISSEEAIKMFPGLEDKFVTGKKQLGDSLAEYMQNICKSEMYQIQEFTDDCAKRMLKQMISSHFGSDSCIKLTRETSLKIDWLQNVWYVLVDKQITKNFKDIPLVPSLVSGHWPIPLVIELVKLTDFLVLKKQKDTILPEGLCFCLRAMSVKVLDDLPEWFPFATIERDIYHPTKEGIVSLFGDIFKKMGETAVIDFHTACQSKREMVESFVQYLTTLAYIENDAKELLTRLKLFKAVRSVDDPGEYASVIDIKQYISGDIDIPSGVQFPVQCIRVETSRNVLMMQLGAENISVASLIQKIVEHLLHYKHHKQTILLMNYLMRKPDMIERNQKLCEHASQLPFLKARDNWYKPSDLFDPTSPFLQNLLLGENLFPEQLENYQPEEMRVLRKLGLKGEDKVDASVLLLVSNRLDSIALNIKNSEDLYRKASAFMDAIGQHPHLLDKMCSSSSTLGKAIVNLSCIPVADAPSDYPVGLPWFSDKLCKPSQAKVSEFCLLSGAVVPMVDCTYGTLIKYFKWDLMPEIKTVLSQMSLIRRHYNVKYKPDYTRAVQKIYRYMNQHRHMVLDRKGTLKNEELIWVGSSFQIPLKVIISKRTNDLDLEPYFFYLPEEFKEMEDLFLQLGCYRQQNSHTLLSVLQTIQKKHLEATDTSIISMKRDTEVVLQILTSLASERKSGTLDIDDSEILMLTEPDSAERLCLQHVSDCIFYYDEDELDPEEEEHTYFIVNRSLPESVAKDLGVKSLKRKTILGATEELSFENWGQSEPLTTRICTLLRDGYKDGLSVLKELVQNADDAGSSIVKFLYDERDNDDARRIEKMLSGGLIECQGPALWVYNDSLFTEEDLVNITKLNGGTKAEYQDKIGKFGLGFCSVYNLTDVPSFISGKDMVIFDPHETYLEDARQKRGKGLRIRLSKRHMIRRSVDQFKPYNSVFGCNLLETNFSSYKGTLFRLPLRTELQAKKSEICKEACSKADVLSLVSKLIENAGNILLFTQCVTTVEVYHLQNEETDPAQAKLIFSVKKNTENMNKKTENALYDRVPRYVQGVLKRVPTYLKEGKDFSEIHRVDIIQELYKSDFNETEMQKVLPQKLKSSWIVSWALGTNESFRLSRVIADKRAVPLSSVAVPVKEGNGLMPVPMQDTQQGFYQAGHLFCFLPLPIKTDLKFHINGCFTVTSDRRGLVSITEDDKRKDEKFKWNWVLMDDSVVKGYVELLIFLSKMCSDGYKYSSLWPLKGTRDVNVLKDSFFRTLIIDKLKLFRGVKDWLSIDEIVFLDPNIRCNKEIGDIAFEMLSCIPARLPKSIIDMPSNVMKVLKECQVGSRPVISQAMITEEELILHFLSTIGCAFWEMHIEKRNKFVLYALKSKNHMVITKLHVTKCIPSDFENILCRPNELVNPWSEIAAMFKVADGKFPQKEGGFTDEHVIGQLVGLGMNDKFLSKELLIDRCRSVEEMEKSCGFCAEERCLEILKYCGRFDVLHDLHQDKETVSELRRNMSLPVLPCPSDWKFSWKADELQKMFPVSKCSHHEDLVRKEIQFAKPTELFREALYICSGSICSFVDEMYVKRTCALPEDLFKAIGVKCDLTIDILSCQLNILPGQYKNPDQQFSNLEKISRSVYDYLASITSDKPDEELAGLPYFIEMRESKIILVGRELITPCKAAFDIREDCPPELYRLSEANYKRKRVFRALGVMDYFPVSFLASVLKRIYSAWVQRQCTPSVIDTVACILRNLCDSMNEENTSLENLFRTEVNIVAPDVDGFLRPTKELVIEDPAYISSAALHILHGKISPETGRALGVMSKQRKIVQNLSTSFFKPFGQNESLVTRLAGILEDHPCDSSIMKELIQNADDAGATEIHIIKNYLCLPTEKLFGKNEMQGPSLCIYNDSYFTEDDFEGIRKLGIGSKRADPSKTGQYGIGFNAVYHLTDVPSFLSKGPGLGSAGQLCVFDPLISYLEGHVTEENPGIKCDVELVNESFPDMMLGYPITSSMRNSGQGTVFRLPLRQKQSEISSNVVTVESMNELIEQLKLDMFECLLFLKSVRSIKVLENTEKGLIEEFSVEAKLSVEDTASRNRYYSEVREVVKANIDARQYNLSMQPLEIIYTVYIEDSQGRKERWLIVNRFGFEHIERIPIILSAFREKTIGMLPVASVALPWPDDKWKKSHGRRQCASRGKSNSRECRAYCFLPLPVETGLPLQVNGHFALDKSRRNLWDEGIWKTWNDFVIEKLLSRAFISAIQYMKQHFVVLSFAECSQESILLAVLEIFHEQFPLLENATGAYWKLLVKSFYRLVVTEDEDIFPSVQTIKSGTKDCFIDGKGHVEQQLKWVPLSKSRYDFHGTFNIIPSVFSSHELNEEIGYCTEITLKKMGMNIIETPLKIKKSLEQCKIDHVPACSPAAVIDFLKTYDDVKSRNCQLGGINVCITDTTVYDIPALKSILIYICFEENFQDNIDGLPLCLTNDEILHTFSKDAPVFCSEMCDTLTGSANQFIHSDLVEMINRQEFYEAGVIKSFGVSDLLSIIAETFDTRVMANGKAVEWNKDHGVPVHPSSVQCILDFIYAESLEKSSPYNDRTYLNQVKFHENVRKLNNWSFIPSCQNIGTQTKYTLIPVNQTKCLLHISSRNGILSDILLKFDIPILDASVFTGQWKHLLYPLQEMLPSSDRPTELLECLLYHKHRIQRSNLKCEEGLLILSYFDDSLAEMKRNMDENSLKHKLKGLPLYITYQETVTDIEQVSNVFVLLSEIPRDGIDVWAQQTGILLLKNSYKLTNLFKFLKLSRVEALDIYINKLLPSRNHLPRETWEIHITYIKDKLLATSLGKKFDAKQIVLVEQMKHFAFVSVCGNDKTASEFYDHNNPVFKYMLTEEMFLPAEYRTFSWMSFMKAIGLKQEPTGEMLIEFTHELEARIHSPISKQTEKQSSALINCLYNGIWSEQILKQIKGIRFVVPHRVDRKEQSIVPQPGGGNTLVCLSEAVNHVHKDYCWSTLNLLPRVPNSPEMLRSLGIYSSPPVNSIVKHCQNVADIFKVQLEGKQVHPEFVKNLMEKLYEQLLKNFHPSMKQNFQVTPIVFQPEDNKMLQLKQVVINLSKEEEVKPFLYKLPNYYGRYEDLFTQLGSDKSALCSHYSMVLEAIKLQFGDESVPPNQLLCVKKALENIVRLLDKETEPFFSVTKLYIPNKKRILKCSKALTVSNNFDVEKRVKGKLELDFFIGFKKMDIKSISDPALPFEKFPLQIRPDILTDVVVEEILTDHIKKEESVIAKRIERQLKSPPFVEGILRLVKHQMKSRRECFDQSIETKFMLQLTNVHVTKVSGLKTFLAYKGRRIEATDRDVSCFIQSQPCDQSNSEETTTHELYFQFDDNKDLLKNLIEDPDGLVKLIDICTDGSLEKDLAHLPMLLGLLNQSSEIQEKLDKMRIDAYDLPVAFPASVFPKPGTYVEERFHPFLQQSIYPFKEHEYEFIALEIDDTEENVEPVYIYAHIIKENERRHRDTFLDITYKVDVGARSDEYINVPIYRLYKFFPIQSEVSNAVVIFDIDPIGSLPIDENFRRIREMLIEAWNKPDRKSITRRLLTRWHPDRNREHREYVQRLFNYINEIVIKLENGEIVDDIVTNETGRMPPDMSRSSFGSASRAVFNRGHRYARAFHNNMHEYNRSSCMGNFTHHRAEEAVVKHIAEAKRWQRQAQLDFTAAQSNLTTGKEDKSFNWVCYKCHQAAEKALKAAWFSKNANRALRKDHDLTNIACGLDDGHFMNKAAELERITGNYFHMRYPDAVFGHHQIPSEMFDCTKAEKALLVTRHILDMASEFIG